jgi:tRNA (guanosine-2'-O-)-methyltransferase
MKRVPRAPQRRIDPQELLTERRIARIDAVVAARVSSLTVVLESVHDPHNLAAVLRTAEGLGLREIHAIASAKGFRPNSAVTQGADKWIDLRFHPDAESCAATLAREGHALLGSRLGEDPVHPLHALSFDRPTALVFGNEHAGLSAEMAAHCSAFFRIPMTGFSQSFNVSVAVGIALAQAMEWRRQRGLGGDLDEAERTAMRERFYRLATHVKWEE